MNSWLSLFTPPFMKANTTFKRTSKKAKQAQEVASNH